MATYNGERFLDQQLRSLSEQTQLPDELIICDDRSTDGTAAIVRRFSEDAPFPVKLFFNEQNVGWRRNFLRAAALCHSEYIAFCDQDDVWLKNKLAVVTSYLQANRCVLLQHGYRLIDDDGNFLSEGINYREVAREAPWRHSLGLTQVFHRSVLEFFDLWDLSEDHFIDNAKMAHDQWISFLCSLFDGVVSIDDVLLYYRQHQSNIIGWRVDESSKVIRNTLKTTMSRFHNGADLKKKREGLIWSLQRRVSAAAARRQITQKMVPRVAEDKRPLLLQKHQYYSDDVDYQTRRLATYISPSRSERLRAILSIARQGLYQKHGKRGGREVMVDLVYGVLS
jgi:glycosyltransferase involved in cell wall biosynthesis